MPDGEPSVPGDDGRAGEHDEEAVPRGGSPAPASAGPARTPGWREVLLVAALVLGVVFGVEILSSLLPPVREAFRGFPVTIAVLVVGTIGLLVLIARRGTRD